MSLTVLCWRHTDSAAMKPPSVTFTLSGGGGAGGPFGEHRAGRRRRRTRRRGSRSGKLCLNLLELPLQQLGLAFEALDLRRLRRRLRASSGRNEQRRAQKCGARHQLLLEIHDRPPSKTRAGDPVPPPSATIPPVNNR